MSEVKTTITMNMAHPNHPMMCAKDSTHEVIYSYSNGFDIRIKKEVRDTVYPYVQVFIPRNKCSIIQTVG
jgi:hypothetical protein